MTAAPDTSELDRDCESVADEFARRLPGLELGTLRVIQHMLQLRLGTGTEEPCDAERAQVVALEINLRRPAETIQPDLDRLNDRPASP
jgi:hypothetical protein